MIPLTHYDIKAVQTLSRLNRSHPQKYDTFVLDFANKTAIILNCFYRTIYSVIFDSEVTMKLTNMTIEEMCHTTEKQVFDRKSARIEASAIAVPIIAFANADGGLLAVGIEDNGEITGIDNYTNNVNDIRRANFDFCRPSVMVDFETVDCIDKNGNHNHILLIRIPQSGELHANQKDEVFLRVGDKSKKLNFEERMELMYAKGMRFYEDEPVYRSTLDDIDMAFVKEYCHRIGYGKTPEEYIRQNKDYVVNVSGRQEMSVAAIMMFGKEPQRFFPRSRVRFIRYEGTEAKVGAEMNVIKDKIFEGRILELVERTVEYVRTQIKEHTYLGPDARFVTEPEYPEFVWKEIIVNAIAHRDYSIKGTDIQIKMFDDHITVESPGTLPGTVRLNNMREIHFSRNPKMAQLLHEYEYVREFGEGVDRMYKEMEAAGLPDPEYKTVAFMVHATIKNKRCLAEMQATKAVDVAQDVAQDVARTLAEIILSEIKANEKVTRDEIAKKANVSKKTVEREIKKMGNVHYTGRGSNGHWVID